MLRHYYVSDDLDELEVVEKELEAEGFTEPQIHVLSLDDCHVEQHRLHEVESLLKQDVIRGSEIGAGVGVVVAMLALVIPYMMDWTSSAAGWLPFIFLSVLSFGFCTWEGGFIGFQKTNVHFARFQEALIKGKHILFVDVDPVQEHNFGMIMKNHPNMEPAGCGAGSPHWVVSCQDTYNSVMRRTP
ncbi:NAD/FAD-utilizing enzyme [Moritella sp. 24]|uniref:NAD/FAD-utilizing enzyme n=1 Tax=Moritella sp. 24 TaxID=2746230 RepID=UPI001BAD0CB6|nr:NAD/FAD-utilizing enzyme [Moritella sp. 24]QUM76979.1 NAD/FAD-utilizing enzyme [Moritella sp. 24]